MIIVDRIESDFAIIEDNETIKNIPLQLLPENVAEGDVLIKIENKYVVDHFKTTERKDSITIRFNKLKKK